MVLGVPVTIANRDVTLSGHFADDSLFSLSLDSRYISPDVTLTVKLVPEPSIVLLVIVGILLMAVCLRERTVR